MSRADALTVAGVLLLAAVLLWVLITWWPRPPVEPTVPPPTPRVIVVTATPRAVEAGPVLPTRTPAAATATFTPLPDRLPMTPAATVTVTRVPPSETPRPERSPVQRG